MLSAVFIRRVAMQSGAIEIVHLPAFVLPADLTAVALFTILGLALSAAIIPYLPAEGLVWALSMQ